jgi:hypothetical protein
MWLRVVSPAIASCTTCALQVEVERQRQWIPSQEVVCQRLRTWERERNDARCQIHWRFPTPQARSRLPRLDDKLLAGDDTDQAE